MVSTSDSESDDPSSISAGPDRFIIFQFPIPLLSFLRVSYLSYKEEEHRNICRLMKTELSKSIASPSQHKTITKTEVKRTI